MGLKWMFVLLSVLGAVRAQRGILRDPFERLAPEDGVFGDEIPGVAGVDYPVLATVPRTDFHCDELPYPGYFADQQAYCQVFYICERGGRGTGFLCPNGTLFNQEFLVCDWWYHVDCARALDFYSVNEVVVRAMEEVDAGRTRQDGVYFNARGEPISAARIPGGRTNNYNPLGAGRSFISPAIRNRFTNNGRLLTQNNFGRIANGVLNTTPRSAFILPNAFSKYRQQNPVGAPNKYPYRIRAFSNGYKKPEARFNNVIRNNRIDIDRQDNGRYRNDNVGSEQYNNAYGNGNGDKERQDNGRYRNDNVGSEQYNNAYGNGNGDKERQDNRGYRNDNVINGNGIGDKERQDNGGYRNDNVINGNGIGDKERQDNERYRGDDGNSRTFNNIPKANEGYHYDRPRNELRGENQVFGDVDPAKAYLPPLK